MAFEIKDMSGFLFKNETRTEENNRAHAQGSCVINGKEYWMNCWTKEGANGKFQSCMFKLKDKQPERNASDNNFEEDIPF